MVSAAFVRTKEGNVLFNDTLNTFYSWLYGVSSFWWGHTVQCCYLCFFLAYINLRFKHALLDTHLSSLGCLSKMNEWMNECLTSFHREGQGGTFAPTLENLNFEYIIWNERKNTIFYAKYHDIRSIVFLLPEELLTFCSVIYSNLSKKMSSHFTRWIQDNIAPTCIFFCGCPWI